MRKSRFILALLTLCAMAFALVSCGGGGGGDGVPPPAAPQITGVSPDEAKQGQEIQITGTGFGATQGTSTLKIGGVSALPTDIVSWSAVEIRAKVPVGASTGTVTVTLAGVQSSPGLFVLLWTNENPVNTEIATELYEQSEPVIVSDGAGGAIIAWKDMRNGTDYDIYARRVDSSGAALWADDGVAISTAVDDQVKPVIVSDGAGGAIIAWQDMRNGTDYDIYAQRVDASGAALWATNGIAVSTAVDDQNKPAIAPDGAGGAIIAWDDYRTQATTSIDIYAQRVDANGAALWTANGVVITNAPDGQDYPAIVTDGAGGAIIAWEDTRDFGATSFDIYVQRVDASGAALWATNGVAVSTATLLQVVPVTAPDGAGGAIIAWMDARSGTQWDIYASRVDSSGTALWTADGVEVSRVITDIYDQMYPVIAPDGAGGAIIAWEEPRGTYDIFAQRVDASGTSIWQEDDVYVSNYIGTQISAMIVPDDNGGAVIAWHDDRNSNFDIYAQLVDASGNPLWAAGGVGICTAAIDQLYPVIAPDGEGGAIIAWQDMRNGTDYDIYAQGISASGRQ